MKYILGLWFFPFCGYTNIDSSSNFIMILQNIQILRQKDKHNFVFNNMSTSINYVANVGYSILINNKENWMS